MFIEKNVTAPVVTTEYHEIQHLRFLTPETFVLRFDRGDLQFKAGQHIVVGLKGESDLREYSIYSGEKDDFLEILVREVVEGTVSIQLKNCRPGQLLQVNGPFGSFEIEKFDMFTRKLIFIASGTGISPFHSFVISYPGIDYMLFHGVRNNNEAYDRDEYDPRRYFLCTSKDNKGGGHKGRITKYLPHYPFDTESLFYVCGNNNMIYEVCHILRDKGVPAENILSEIYF